MEYHIEKSQPKRDAKELRGKRSSKASVCATVQSTGEARAFLDSAKTDCLKKYSTYSNGY